jgi:hypothetical protein
LGVYGTYTGDIGFYADAVVQSGRHRYTFEPLLSLGTGGKGNSQPGSIEVGQAFALAGSGWSVEPQLPNRVRWQGRGGRGAIPRSRWRKPAVSWCSTCCSVFPKTSAQASRSL